MSLLLLLLLLVVECVSSGSVAVGVTDVAGGVAAAGVAGAAADAVREPELKRLIANFPA